MERIQGDPLLYATVSIADSDGVSIQEVIDRGFNDLALRVAKWRLDMQERARK